MFGLFSPKAPAPAPAPTANQSGQVQQNQTAASMFTNVPPSQQSVQQSTQTQQGQESPQQAKNPLDDFAAMWQPVDPSKAPADPLKAPIFGADPAKLAEAAKNINFAQSIPQELMTRVMAGGDPQAIVDLVNHAVQTAVGLGAQLTATTTEQAFGRFGERLDQAMPSRISKAQLTQLPEANPALSHPAAQPLVQLARTMMQQQNPGKSPSEIAEMASRYLTTLGTEVFSNSDQGRQLTRSSQQQQDGDSQDFDSWAFGKR